MKEKYLEKQISEKLTELITDTYSKAIEVAIEMIENNPCDADGYHYCSTQDVYKQQLQKLIEVK